MRMMNNFTTNKKLTNTAHIFHRGHASILMMRSGCSVIYHLLHMVCAIKRFGTPRSHIHVSAKQAHQRCGGFALLFTMIVVSVLLAIGLTLLNITVKQFTLSSTARESEVAFHAANTGLECMHYYRNTNATDYFAGGSVEVSCGGVSGTPTVSSDAASGGTVYHYEYAFNGVGTAGVYVETSMYVLDMRESDSGVTNYPINEGIESADCGAGVVCTVITSRGHNRSQSQLDSIRTVQRELTIEF